MTCHEDIREGTFPCRGGEFHRALLAAAVACFPQLHASCRSPLPEVLLFVCFHPGDTLFPVMLTEPINLAVLISMLLCSPGVGGLLQSCSGEGSAGDIARAPPAAVGHPGPLCPLFGLTAELRTDLWAPEHPPLGPCQHHRSRAATDFHASP